MGAASETDRPNNGGGNGAGGQLRGEGFEYVRATEDASVPSSGGEGKRSSSSPLSASSWWSSFLRKWWTESLWPGMGLFGESYLLFSIGTLTPLWKELYPDCWKQVGWSGTSVWKKYLYYSWREQQTNAGNNADADDDGSCSPRLLESLTYGVVLGVVIGMVLLGYWSNHIGRRKGSILTAGLMVGGSLGLVALSLVEGHLSGESLFGGTVACLVVFGIGVGGEYPLSASLASENAMAVAAAEANERKTAPVTSFLHGNTDPNEGSSSSSQQHQNHRGRKVQLVFAMQGMGIWFNSLTMLGLLWALTGRSGNNDDNNGNGYNENLTYRGYDARSLRTVWRVTYAIGAMVLCFVLLTRILYLEESRVWLESNRANNENTATTTTTTGKNNNASASGDTNDDGCDGGHDHGEWDGLALGPSDENDSAKSAAPAPTRANKLRLVHEQYGSRMFGASMAWLLWDVSFYGNKLFQATFLLALVGDNASLTELTGAAALNATVALMGYYGAALLVDLPPKKRDRAAASTTTELLRRQPQSWCSPSWPGGRTSLQSIGLVTTGVLFVLCGFLTAASAASPSVLVPLYLLSSLAGQLGPNCTTFLIPAEIVPTDQRTYCHGLCAACGKIGALIASVVFHRVGNDGSGHAEHLFYLSGGAGFLAAIATHFFVPETSGLELRELDRQWTELLKGNGSGRSGGGRPPGYDGPAVHPDHLSRYERYRMRETAATFPPSGSAAAAVAAAAAPAKTATTTRSEPFNATKGGNEPAGGYFS